MAHMKAYGLKGPCLLPTQMPRIVRFPSLRWLFAVLATGSRWARVADMSAGPRSSYAPKELGGSRLPNAA